MISKKRMAAAIVSLAVAGSNIVSLMPSAYTTIIDPKKKVDYSDYPTLVLNSIPDDEMSHVKLSKIMELMEYYDVVEEIDEDGEVYTTRKMVHPTLPEDYNAVWVNGEEYTVYEGKDTEIDLSAYMNTGSSYLSLIVGSARQLDNENNTVFEDIRVTRSTSNLKRYNATIDLTTYSEEQRKELSIDILLDNIKLDTTYSSSAEGFDFSNVNTVWEYTCDYSEDEGYSDYYYKAYKRGSGDKIDMSGTSSRGLIFGNGEYALDLQNSYVTVSPIAFKKASYSYEAYTQDSDGKRTKITDVNYSTGNNGYFSIHPYDYSKDEQYYINITSNSDLSAYTDQNITMNVYRASEYFQFDEDGNAQEFDQHRVPEGLEPIDSTLAPTGKMIKADMSKENAGYTADFSIPENTNDLRNVFVITYTELIEDPETHEKKDTGNIVLFDFLTVSADKGVPSYNAIDYSIKNKKTSLEASDREEDYFEGFSNRYSYLTFSTMSNTVSINRPFSSSSIDLDLYLNSDNYIDDDFYFVINGFRRNKESELVVPQKIYEGRYSNISNLPEENDVTDKIMAKSENNGYEIAGSRSTGYYFTIVLDDNNLYVLYVDLYGRSRPTDPSDEPSDEQTTYERDVDDFDTKPIQRDRADSRFKILGIDYIDENGEQKSTDVKNIDLFDYKTLDTSYMDSNYTVVVSDMLTDDQMSSLIPSFYKFDNTNARMKVRIGDSDEQISGESKVDFSKGTVRYTVATDNKDKEHYKDRSKNYDVTVLTKQTGGAKLYVYGPSERTVYFNDYYGNYHDIVLLNMGDASLTHPRAELIDGENIKLDKYWNIYGGDNEKLEPFVDEEGGFTNNIAKIRLLPDGDGVIKGTLKITADGQEDVYITLKGQAGNPSIITDELSNGVKYVPYSKFILNDNMFDWIDVEYYSSGSSLPRGMRFNRETGELYGTPKETGEFEVNIGARFTIVEDSFKSRIFPSSEVKLKLVIDENTNVRVYRASDESDGYDIKQTIGTDEYTEQYDFVKTYYVSSDVLRTIESNKAKDDPTLDNGTYSGRKHYYYFPIQVGDVRNAKISVKAISSKKNIWDGSKRVTEGYLFTYMPSLNGDAPSDSIEAEIPFAEDENGDPITLTAYGAGFIKDRDMGPSSKNRLNAVIALTDNDIAALTFEVTFEADEDSAWRYIPYEDGKENNFYNVLSFNDGKVAPNNIPDGELFKQESREYYTAVIPVDEINKQFGGATSTDPNGAEGLIEGDYYGAELTKTYTYSGEEVASTIEVDQDRLFENLDLDVITDELFVSNGAFVNFETDGKFWFNGKELKRGEDYIAESGSTEITIMAQTLKDNIVDGENTIAAEFRVNDGANKTMKKTAQNFRIQLIPKEFESDILVKLIDEDNEPIADEKVEIHSEVYGSTTNTKGFARFNNVVSGTHEITANGASASFDIYDSDKISLDGNTVYAFADAQFMLTVQRKGNTLDLVSVSSIEDINSAEYNDDPEKEDSSSDDGSSGTDNTSSNNDSSSNTDSSSSNNDSSSNTDDTSSNSSSSGNSGGGSENGSDNTTGSTDATVDSGNGSAVKETGESSGDASSKSAAASTDSTASNSSDSNSGTSGNSTSGNGGNTGTSGNVTGGETGSDAGSGQADDTPATTTGSQPRYAIITISFLAAVISLFYKKEERTN